MADVKNEETCNMMMKQVSRWLAFIGKFASSALFTIVYTYSAELYPTCVRGSALGLASAGGRIGGAISPLIFGVDDTLPWFSNTFFGLSSIIGTFLRKMTRFFSKNNIFSCWDVILAA